MMKNNRNRAIGWTFLGLIVLTAAYWVSPYVATIRFARDAAQGDVLAVRDRLDLPRIRNSFARQIVRAYPVDAAILAKIDPAARYAAGLLAITYVDALIAEHLNDDVVTQFLTARQNEADTVSGWNIPSMRSFDGAWAVTISAGFTGPISFAVDSPPTPEGQYRLGFRLIGGTWRLVSIGLPKSVFEIATADLKKRSVAK